MKIIKYVTFISLMCTLLILFPHQDVGAEAFSLRVTPDTNTVVRGEIVDYVLIIDFDKPADVSMPAIHFIFSDNIQLQSDSIQAMEKENPEKLIKVNPIYGNDGFLAVLDPALKQAIIKFSIRVKDDAYGSVTCRAEMQNTDYFTESHLDVHIPGVNDKKETTSDKKDSGNKTDTDSTKKKSDSSDSTARKDSVSDGTNINNHSTNSNSSGSDSSNNHSASHGSTSTDKEDSTKNNNSENNTNGTSTGINSVGAPNDNNKKNEASKKTSFAITWIDIAIIIIALIALAFLLRCLYIYRTNTKIDKNRNNFKIP